MAEILAEIRDTTLITQKLSEKSCGALATLSGICNIPHLKKMLVNYIETLIKNREYKDKLLSCKNNFGYRRHWWNIFIICIYGHNGYDPILPARFLNTCFDNTFVVYSCVLGQLFDLDVETQKNIIKNNGVLVSFGRKISATKHWFNILNVVEIENDLYYKFYDTVGMISNMRENQKSLSLSWVQKYATGKDYYDIFSKEDLEPISLVNIITDEGKCSFFDALGFSKNSDLYDYHKSSTPRKKSPSPQANEEKLWDFI